MKRIYLFVTPFFPSPESWRGGYCLDAAQALIRDGRFDVRVFVPGTGPDYEMEGVHVHRFPRTVLPCELAPFLVKRRNMRAFVRRVEAVGVDWDAVDVCHVHTVSFAPYACAAKLRNPRLLSVLQHHFTCPVHLRSGRLGEIPGHATWLHFHWRSLCAAMDVHIFTSERSRSSFGKMFVDAKGMEGPLEDLRNRLLFGRWMRPFDPPRRSYVLYNGVDGRKFFPGAKPRRKSGLVIGCVANFNPLKGHLTLLKAVERLRGDIPDLEVRLVGSGGTKADCEAFVKTRGLSDIVHFEREVPHGEIADLYRTFDLFVLPSTLEGFCCAYVEAHACGVPVMGCRGVSLEEAIPAASWDEWLVPPHDDAALAECIRKWCSHRTGAEGQPLALDLDIDHLIGHWLDFAQKALR